MQVINCNEELLNYSGGVPFAKVNSLYDFVEEVAPFAGLLHHDVVLFVLENVNESGYVGVVEFAEDVAFVFGASEDASPTSMFGWGVVHEV
jgi:hypothetical protein